AACFPRSNPLRQRGYRAPYRVIRLSEDEFVAVPPEGGDAVRLTPDQVAVHRLHHVRLAKRIAAAIGFTPECAPFAGLPALYRIGSDRPLAGYTFPVFLAIPRGADALERIFDAVAVRTTGPFLLCTPTRRFCPSRVDDELARRNSALLPLNECLDFDRSANIGMTSAGREFVDAFRAANLPKPETLRETAFFPTPADACWCDVRMQFVDGETLSIAIGDVTATQNYTQLGMASRRNGRPTRQWELLRIFAAGYGLLDWSSRQADRRHQKQKELLSKRLRTFFRIDEEPFCIAGNGWQARFALQPDV
ncbi:MAG: hypothetical protein ACE5KM_14260, partial [Planctomycetaceae bacterium]